MQEFGAARQQTRTTASARADPYLERERAQYETSAAQPRDDPATCWTSRACRSSRAICSKLLGIDRKRSGTRSPAASAPWSATARSCATGAAPSASSDKLDLVKGRVQGHPDGFGFLMPEDGGARPVPRPARRCTKVLHGDSVMARVTGLDRRGRREGTIVEVLERANTQRRRPPVRRARRRCSSCAEDRRISQDILVPPERAGGAKPGQVVVVEIIAAAGAAHASRSAAWSRCSATTPIPAWKSRSRCASTTCRTSFRRRSRRRRRTLRDTVRRSDLQGPRGPARAAAGHHRRRDRARFRRCRVSASRSKGKGYPPVWWRSPTSATT